MESFDFSCRLVGSIEFAGTICAGKMTVLEALKKELKKSGSSIEVIAEDLTIQSKSVTTAGHYERQILLANLVSAEIIRSRDRLLLVHRGLYDAIAFMRAYVKFGLAEESSALFQINAWRTEANRLIDLVVFVNTPANVAYRRAKKKFFTLFRMEADPIFDIKFFEILEQCYSDLEKEISAQKMVVIDGRISPEENVETILARLSSFCKNGSNSGSDPKDKKEVANSVIVRMMGYAN